MYTLIKIQKMYLDDYRKFELSPDEKQTLFRQFDFFNPKVSGNALVSKFATYVVKNLENIIRKQSIRGKGKIYFINDPRYPLSVYVDKYNNILINFSRRIVEYTKYELLSIILSGFVYSMLSFSNFKDKNSSMLKLLLSIILYNFMMNNFGKYFGIYGDNVLMSNTKILSAIYINTYFFKSSPSSYLLFYIHKFEAAEVDKQLIDILNKISVTKFDLFTWIKLLDDYALNGINLNTFLNTLIKRYSSDTVLLFESFNRMCYVFYSSMFSGIYGPVDYTMPKYEGQQYSLLITKGLLSYL